RCPLIACMYVARNHVMRSIEWLKSPVATGQPAAQGTADTETEEDDDTRVDPDRCSGDVRSCLRHSRSLARYDAARRSDVAGDGIGGNDASRRRGCHRLRDIT